MKTVIKIPLIFFFILFSFQGFSWEEDSFKNVQELRKRFFDQQKRIGEELKKSMKLKADMFDRLEEKLETFMDGVGKKVFDSFFEDDFFKDDFFKDMEPSKGSRRLKVGRWKETDEKMIFILNIESKKGVPLNIEIKNGVIKIAGDVVQKNEKFDQKGKKRFASQRVIRIRQSYSIPEGLDEKNPQIKEEKGKIKIIFKKLKNYKLKKKKPVRQNLKPIDPSFFDKTI